ncbi:3934_t:CDS:2 [Scutellospora calospora]|uniref:3934_t:CDS:1 n=1 Tax=Scutellospora calospora TaxID=85575 RepID=A0ACA9K2T8_9GLOM|nr:3934_t:CDS:2 [Scutellospora calospora]
MVYLFDVPSYFIMLRETLEFTIIIAVLLSFIDKLIPDDKIVLRKHLKKQIWIGSICGLFVSIVVGAALIVVFYTTTKNLYENNEDAWGKGSLSLVASIIITLMSLSLIRVQQWKTKWENKLQKLTEQYLERNEKGNKWALILLPFTVICREALEAVIFIAGVGYGKEATSLPIPVIMGTITGIFIGWLIYRGSHVLSIAAFFISTTILLLFIAAGLFSSAVHKLNRAAGGHTMVIWKLNCCDPEENDFWDVMGSIFGWTNEATIDSTISYFVYWLMIIIVVVVIRLRENKGGINDEENVEKENASNDKTVSNETSNDKAVSNETVNNEAIDEVISEIKEK